VDEPPRLRDLLGEAGARVGIERAAEAGALWARWEEIVGSAIAEHAEPTSLRRGVLRIRAVSPAWATEIGYLKEQIVSAANEALGAQLVTDVQLWTGPGPIRRRGAARGSEPSVEAPRQGPRTAPPADPEEAFERARAAWWKRRSQGRSEAPQPTAVKPENPW
jgi:hypothetical protein